jgi:hypothetical protein
MEKNVRRNPFGNMETTQQQNLPPKLESVKSTLPPKVDTVKSSLPPKSKQEEQPEPISQPINQPEINHYTQESNTLLSSEYEALKQYNSPKSYIRLTTERLPANQTLLKESSLPFALIINPLNPFESEVYTIII